MHIDDILMNVMSYHATGTGVFIMLTNKYNES